MKKGISVGIVALMLGIVLITTSYTYYSLKAGKPLSNMIAGLFQQLQEADKTSNLNVILISYAQSSIEKAVLECGSKSGLSYEYTNSWICNKELMVPSKNMLKSCIESRASYYFDKLNAENLNDAFSNQRIIFDKKPRLKIEEINSESIAFIIEGAYHYKEHETTYYGKIAIRHVLPNIRLGMLFDVVGQWYRDKASDIAERMCNSIMSKCNLPTVKDYISLGMFYQNSINDYFRSRGEEYVNCTVSLLCHDEKIESSCDPFYCVSWKESKCKDEAHCIAPLSSSHFITGKVVEETEASDTYSPPDDDLCIVCTETNEKCCGEECSLQCTQKPKVCKVACGSTFCCDFDCSPVCNVVRLYASALYDVKCVDLKYVTRYNKESDHIFLKTRIYQSYFRAYKSCEKCWCDCGHIGGSLGVGESPPENSEEPYPPSVSVYGGIAIDEVF